MFDLSSFGEASGPEPLRQSVAVFGHVPEIVAKARQATGR
jgi:hypothetical protein